MKHSNNRRVQRFGVVECFYCKLSTGIVGFRLEVLTSIVTTSLDYNGLLIWGRFSF